MNWWGFEAQLKLHLNSEFTKGENFIILVRRRGKQFKLHLKKLVPPSPSTYLLPTYTEKPEVRSISSALICIPDRYLRSKRKYNSHLTIKYLVRSRTWCRFFSNCSNWSAAISEFTVLRFKKWCSDGMMFWTQKTELRTSEPRILVCWRTVNFRTSSKAEPNFEPSSNFCSYSGLNLMPITKF